MLWDVAEMTPVWSRRTGEAVLLATVDGSTVRCYADLKLFRTWDVDHADREKVAMLYMPGRDPQQGVGAFLPDGRFAMQWNDNEGTTLHVYDASGGLELRRSRPWPEMHYGRFFPGGHRGRGTILFGPDGSRFDLVENRNQPPLLGGSEFHLTHLVATDSRTFVAGRGTDPTSTHDHVWESITGRIMADLPDEIPAADRAVLSSDGRFLASLARDVVIVHDFKEPAATARLPASGASTIAFSPDGSRLATAQYDGTVLIWTVPRRVTAWRPADADRLWTQLISDDAGKAWQAVWQLLDHPAKATELLAARLRPISEWDDTAEQISRLDHPKYPVRERATRELAGRGRDVEDALRAVLKAPRSEEQRTRAEQLLSKIDSAIPPTGESLRGLRCVWLLERIGSAEAKKILAVLTSGRTGSQVTVEAKAALERLK
jgi:WD40 repeat protein